MQKIKFVSFSPVNLSYINFIISPDTRTQKEKCLPSLTVCWQNTPFIRAHFFEPLSYNTSIHFIDYYIWGNQHLLMSQPWYSFSAFNETGTMFLQIENYVQSEYLF